MPTGRTVERTAVDVTASEAHAPAALHLDRIRWNVDAALGQFMDAQAGQAADESLPPLVEVIRDFVSGGKRLRPLFCVCGWVAAGGDVAAPAVFRVGAALELFHAFALIHDDVMDASAYRRGSPTVHRLLAERAAERNGAVTAERFGESAAILVGDICLVWSDELLHDSGVSPQRLSDSRRLLNAMRTEIMAGQYLDVETGGADPSDELDRAWRVIRHKTAAYTVTRPLQIGAALAGTEESLLQACDAYGYPLGEAFQLRDDLLGVFGNPSVTGKSDLDDLRDGKRTVLVALARQQATPGQGVALEELYGNPELDEQGAGRLREIIRQTGAEDVVENMIRVRRDRALDALEKAPMTEPARRSLAELAETATRRQR
ncbi:polyprenyl synthetase family protein [Actinopolyspora halophila]|uniref:polyprenyl synthetase family protein n=1 Tax=Actinopolyspora halophila TaxID=1850 RepID=UPI000366D306|nr:polyprenyl synthetase family protein [Actinopolyspora halophila]